MCHKSYASTWQAFVVFQLDKNLHEKNKCLKYIKMIRMEYKSGR